MTSNAPIGVSAFGISWTRTYGGSDHDEAHAVSVTPSGHYVVAGYTESFGLWHRNAYLLRINANGDAGWAIVATTGRTETARDIIVSADGYVFVGNAAMSDFPFSNDVYLGFIDQAGRLNSYHLLGSRSDHYGFALVEGPYKSVIIAGRCSRARPLGNGYYTFDDQVLLLKTDAMGSMLWHERD